MLYPRRLTVLTLPISVSPAQQARKKGYDEICLLMRQQGRFKAVLHGSTWNIDFPRNTVSCFHDMLHDSTFCPTLLDFLMAWLPDTENVFPCRCNYFRIRISTYAATFFGIFCMQWHTYRMLFLLSHVTGLKVTVGRRSVMTVQNEEITGQLWMWRSYIYHVDRPGFEWYVKQIWNVYRLYTNHRSLWVQNVLSFSNHIFRWRCSRLNVTNLRGHPTLEKNVK